MNSQRTHVNLIPGLDGGGQGAADAVKRVRDGAGEGVHRGNRAETHEGRDQGIFDQILTRLFCDQVLQKLFHVLHSGFSVYPGFR